MLAAVLLCIRASAWCLTGPGVALRSTVRQLSAQDLQRTLTKATRVTTANGAAAAGDADTIALAALAKRLLRDNALVQGLVSAVAGSETRSLLVHSHPDTGTGDLIPALAAGLQRHGRCAPGPNNAKTSANVLSSVAAVRAGFVALARRAAGLEVISCDNCSAQRLDLRSTLLFARLRHSHQVVTHTLSCALLICRLMSQNAQWTTRD
jgi:hypothetical protein